MFRLQSRFETCPCKGSVEYEIAIPLKGITDNHKVSITLPDGDTIEPQIKEDCALIHRNDKQGLWRYDIRITSRDNDEEALDFNIIDVVILEESPANICNELKNSIASMTPYYRGKSWSTNKNIESEALELYRKTNGAELPEVLRVIAFERSDYTTLWRHLLLLKMLQERPVSKNYRSVIAELATEILCTVSISPVVETAWQILQNLLIKPDEKWIFYVRILTETSHNTSGINKSICYETVKQLINSTYPTVRPIILQVAEQICKNDINKVKYIAELFEKWSYKDGVPLLLPVLEMKPNISFSVCAAIRACNYKEAVPLLRSIFSMVSMKQGGEHIAKLLAEWKDEQGKKLLLEKLHLETNKWDISSIITALKQYDDKSLKNSITEIRNQSSEKKMEDIDSFMKNWQEF
nr:hypothetical protein [uncultured Desulfobacter sp.]